MNTPPEDFDFNPDDMETDDITENLNKKKRVNSKKKGNRFELLLTKILEKQFGKSFSRSVGSGARWGQVSNMPDHAKQTLTGDICPPEDFLWVIECKSGYEDKVDFNSVLGDIKGGGCAQLDDFIKQSLHDNEGCGRKPIIIWKRTRKPWLAMLQQDYLDKIQFTYSLKYRDWVMVPLDVLFKETPVSFWFKS